MCFVVMIMSKRKSSEEKSSRVLCSSINIIYIIYRRAWRRFAQVDGQMKNNPAVELIVSTRYGRRRKVREAFTITTINSSSIIQQACLEGEKRAKQGKGRRKRR